MNAMIPSIDIQDGRAVQLVGGKQKALDGGDPIELARRFGRVGDIAVIDLDAAMGKGSNAAIIEKMLPLAPCRVGGGIRDVQSARSWLDRGAKKVILGTKAIPEILRELPKERIIAAVDAEFGKVVIEGWTQTTTSTIEEKIAQLKEYVSGFLVTFVETEGRMQGIDLQQVAQVAKWAGPAAMTVAGGVTTREDLRAIAELGCQAQVGMALYTGRIDLAAGLWAQVKSDRSDGLVSTVVCDLRGVALGLAYSSEESLRVALERGQGVYWSRNRGLWIKGESSGNVQELMRVDLDCDRDTLRFVVDQRGAGFCHFNTTTCWGESSGLSALESTLLARKANAPAGSYTQKLFADPSLLDAKIREEARELTEATQRSEIIHEAADVLYFTMAKLVVKGVALHEIEEALDQRALKISRRGGERKGEV
jgi:phosphoribosyl-ATP pyrophosphohydrolase